MIARLLLASLIVLLPTGALTGCAQTYLSGTPLGEEYIRLAAASSNPITALMQIEPQELTLGRQWVFGVLPLGRIATADEAQLVSTALFKRLSLRGYTPTILPRGGVLGSKAPPHRLITISDATTHCSVPDLLVIRIVRCSVTVQGATALAPQMLLRSSGASADWRMAGFRPQLEAALERASAQALDGLLNQMHL